MIDLPRTKEGYALFLQTEFWRELSRKKRQAVGKCEDCGTEKDLQSHHIRYPWPWFDTTLDDLRVLCRLCHERAHGITGEKQEVKPYSPIPSSFRNLKELTHYRSMRLISREEFDKWKAVILQRPKINRGPRVGRGRKQKKPSKYYVKDGLMHRRKKKKVKLGNGKWKGLNFTYRQNWVNRGSSSN